MELQDVQSSSQSVTTNKPTPSFLMPFLSPYQQCQITEGNQQGTNYMTKTIPTDSMTETCVGSWPLHSPASNLNAYGNDGFAMNSFHPSLSALHPQHICSISTFALTWNSYLTKTHKGETLYRVQLRTSNKIVIIQVRRPSMTYWSSILSAFNSPTVYHPANVKTDDVKWEQILNVAQCVNRITLYEMWIKPWSMTWRVLAHCESVSWNLMNHT